MDQTTFLLKQIHNKMGDESIDLNILSKYQQLSHNCLIGDFHSLINMKSSKSKYTKISQISRHLTSLTHYSYQQLISRFHSPKKTDLSKFITQILFPHSSFRLLLEAKRKNIIIALRKHQPPSPSDLSLFKMIYHTIYSPSTQPQISPQQQINPTQNIKTILISLKKMMGLPTTSKITSSNNHQTYCINLDVKEVISQSLNHLQNTQTYDKVYKLLQQSENKKWFGPRLYNIIGDYNWDSATIKTFLQSLNQVKIKQLHLRSKPSTIKQVFKKITTNLRKHASSINHKITTIPQPQNTHSNLPYENLPLPDLLPFQNKIPQVSRNTCQLQFDVDNFLIKSDEGTIFQKLCQENNLTIL